MEVFFEMCCEEFKVFESEREVVLFFVEFCFVVKLGEI